MVSYCSHGERSVQDAYTCWCARGGLQHSSRVSGHSHLCIPRMKLEIIYTFRRTIPPLLSYREAVIQAPGASQRYASQTKQVVSAQGFNPLRASVGDRAQLPAPDAPWRQSSGIGLPTRIAGPTHEGLDRQWHDRTRDVPSCARPATRAMTHQKLR